MARYTVTHPPREQIRPSAQMSEAALSTHNSDEPLLGPRTNILDYIVSGDIDDKDAVRVFLESQKPLIDDIDFSRVDDASNKSFLDATWRLWKITKDTGLTWTEILDYMGLERKNKKAMPRLQA